MRVFISSSLATGLRGVIKITSPLRLHVVTSRSGIHTASVPLPNGEAYWQNIERWKAVTQDEFINYRWQLTNTVRNEKQLVNFLEQALPETLRPSVKNSQLNHIKTRHEFIEDAKRGLKRAPMAISLTPHILSVINWHDALDDPIRRQFLPLESAFVEDHPSLTLDSLHEEADSPVRGLVHRYPDKALFLVTSICPVYCRFCTRSYAVGGNTETVEKSPMRGGRRRWQRVYEYLEKTPAITDVVVSGGDTYYIEPDDILNIGKTLLEIGHIRRIRFATKGLAVVPCRTLDPNDTWTRQFIDLSQMGRKMGKQVCLHTHINHPSEITWITQAAAKHLFEEGVIVRNQSVLLKGVNDTVETMGTLIRMLADMNIQPYYVYQCDLVKGIEDLRTPLSTILDIEQQLRGTIAGFMMPSFVVDLPEGGGKRLAASGVYDALSGVSTFTAPGLLGKKGQRIYKYHDPPKIDFNKPKNAEQPLVKDELLQRRIIQNEDHEATAVRASRHTGIGSKYHENQKPARSNPSITRPNLLHPMQNESDPALWTVVEGIERTSQATSRAA